MSKNSFTDSLTIRVHHHQHRSPCKENLAVDLQAAVCIFQADSWATVCLVLLFTLVGMLTKSPLAKQHLLDILYSTVVNSCTNQLLLTYSFWEGIDI